MKIDANVKMAISCSRGKQILDMKFSFTANYTFHSISLKWVNEEQLPAILLIRK